MSGMYLIGGRGGFRVVEKREGIEVSTHVSLSIA